MTQHNQTFTGRGRRRKTRRIVLVVDRLAKYVICLGGIGVTATFAAIVLFLFSVVFPLFGSPSVEKRVNAQLPVGAAATQPADGEPVLTMGLDETLASLWILDRQGRLTTYRTSGGELVNRQSLTQKPISAFSNSRGTVAVGYEDGTVQLGRIHFEVEFLSADQLPDAAESLQPGHTIEHKGAVGALTPAGQLRLLRTRGELADPLKVGEEPSPIRLVDYLQEEWVEKFAAMREDGRIYLASITKRTNKLTGEVRRTVRNQELPHPAKAEGKKPVALLFGTQGRQLYVLYRDGWVVRYDLDDTGNARIVEETDLLPSPASSVTAACMLLGRATLIVADSAGGVSGWFPVADGESSRLARAHELRPQPAPVTALGISARDRQFVTADGAGNVVLRHMTSGTTQYKLSLPGGTAISQVELSPQNDAIAVLDGGGVLTLYSMENPYADSSLAQLFLPIHYEGYPRPSFVYQSTGTQDAEPKMSLVPLIFGTIKATLYALLFAVPIAILAAIYTSEFMQPGIRAVVKPTIELMASLPSVVLGFIGALVLAPVVEDIVPAVLLVFVAIPLGTVLFGYAWQLLPPKLSSAVPALAKFALMIVAVVLAGWLAYATGPWMERLLFYNAQAGRGDLKGWLAGQFGSATPGWLIALTPLFAIGLNLLNRFVIKPRFRREGRAALPPVLAGLLDLGRFAAVTGAAMLLALGVGSLLSLAGIDLRGSVVGSYIQRNSLIVGMMMGFAIIPIIYSVSEDALSSVPPALRSASLGAGATPWQTAIRVVLPVATSGIFSACMIGLGRAAGETMIVLMAAGNTPIMEMNLFNGLRALSANIAVELPEAPVGSGHYRVLFLSALVLFALTFVVNTVAELVRLRFRKRAYQL